jgi:hypothetical protein
MRTETGELGELEKLGIWDELIMKCESFPRQTPGNRDGEQEKMKDAARFVLTMPSAKKPQTSRLAITNSECRATRVSDDPTNRLRSLEI